MCCHGTGKGSASQRCGASQAIDPLSSGNIHCLDVRTAVYHKMVNPRSIQSINLMRHQRLRNGDICTGPVLREVGIQSIYSFPSRQARRRNLRGRRMPQQQGYFAKCCRSGGGVPGTGRVLAHRRRMLSVLARSIKLGGHRYALSVGDAAGIGHR